VLTGSQDRRLGCGCDHGPTRRLPSSIKARSRPWPSAPTARPS
jgi:hypothetical protein